MKRYLLPLLMLVTAAAFSQTAPDALRYAYLTPGGTARFLGVGGAFGALGAEFATLSQNPAGLAMYRTSELMLTPALRFANTEAKLPGNNFPGTEKKSHFHFDNIGIVFNTMPRNSKWKTFNVGIGYNQLANFNRTIFYEGDTDGTILNNWFDAARPIMQNSNINDFDPRTLDPFTGTLAYQAGAIYYQNSVPTYDFEGNENATVTRNQILEQSGTMNEMVFSLAGNYDEKLFIGTTVGVPFVRYRLSGEYQEIDNAGVVEFFDDLAYTEYLGTDGVGVNVKLGVIYRASQALRIGAHVHSPTWLRLTDDFNNTFFYRYTDGTGTNSDQANSPSGNFDYRLATPWRAGLSGAMLIQKYGFVSADVEWVDYSASRYNFTADVANSDNRAAERQVNTNIQRLFDPTMNFRVGAEAVLSDFRLRAGLNLLGKPYANESGFNTAYTAGAGVRGESFFLDLGFRFGSGTGSVIPYSGGPRVTTKNRVSDFLLTIGFKF